MKYLNKLLLSIIIVTMGLAAACAPAPAPPETTKAPVENSRDIDVTDAGQDTFNVSSEEGENTDTVEITKGEDEELAATKLNSDNVDPQADDWRLSTPEEQGIDSALLLQMFQKIRDENIDVHSVLLVRNGHLVSEAYFDPYTQDRKHPVFSVTKSVTSMLTGIALEEGYITSVDQKVLDFFPDIAKNTRSEYLQSLTLEHLLTMSAGYNTRTIPFFEVLEQKDESFDTIEHILTYNSILYKPGTTFYYDSGAPHLLSAIIQETTGMSTQAYAQEKLFDPLGISGITWQTDPRGIPLGCTGLELSPRDMAKLGYLYLNRGQWNGAQIVPAAWIEQSTTKHIETKGLMNEAEDDGYGYFWWMDAYGGYSAHGFGGQYIFVVPRLNLVAVFTGGLADPDFPTPRKLMEGFILPAVKSAGPLPASPATSDLQEYVEQIKNPAPQPVAPLPEIAKQISGQTYKIIGSPDSYIQAITLNFKEGQNLYELEAMRLGEKYEVRGGLDRFYVNGPENGHVIALKGYWQDENTFVETLKDFDYIETITQKYTFAGNTLSMDISASTGYSLQLKGKVEAN